MAFGAQPAVRIGVVATQITLEQLGDQVSCFGIQLSAAVECHRLRTMRMDNVGEDFRDVRKAGVPVGGLEGIISAKAK
jgi:hypothetical protein